MPISISSLIDKIITLSNNAIIKILGAQEEVVRGGLWEGRAGGTEDGSGSFARRTTMMTAMKREVRTMGTPLNNNEIDCVHIMPDFCNAIHT